MHALRLADCVFYSTGREGEREKKKDYVQAILKRRFVLFFLFRFWISSGTLGMARLEWWRDTAGSTGGQRVRGPSRWNHLHSLQPIRGLFSGDFLNVEANSVVCSKTHGFNLLSSFTFSARLNIVFASFSLYWETRWLTICTARPNPASYGKYGLLSDDGLQLDYLIDIDKCAITTIVSNVPVVSFSEVGTVDVNN